MKFYQESISQILKHLQTQETGLSQNKAESRLEKYGPNEIKTEIKTKPLTIFLNQFKSFLIYILIFAVLLSLALKHFTDAILIGVILIANAIIGFFQEYSAQKSLEALKKLSKVTAKVYRSGKLIKTDSKNLVPGDVIYLEAGDKVPADCRITDAKRLKVEESSLTGESIPVEKHNFLIKEKVPLPEIKNMLFSSTNLVDGTAKSIVVRTGMQTEIGKITQLIIEAKEEQTPLQKRLDRFGKKIGIAIIIICILILLLLLITKGATITNLIIFGLIAISLAVAAVPTALPAVVTIALSIGVKRLLKKNALVRKLSSVETLGSCNIICTDKTGTLTENKMMVKEIWTLNEQATLTGVGYNPQGTISKKISPLIYQIGLSCNNASHYREEGIWKISGDPTEAALIVSAKKAGVDFKFEKIDEYPFDSERKIMSVLIKEDKDLIMHTKGAPKEVLKKCTHVLTKGKEKKITPKITQEINKQIDTLSSKALRVLGFAYKIPASKKDFTEDSLVFVGLQAMMDPPRPDVIESIQKTKDAKIRVIMITGDYKETAKAIAKEIGIEGKTLTGEELDKMSDEELVEALDNQTNIFARVIPQHKQKIITALQKKGNVVAMTGDGVNDAPALKKANIGVAVDSGTDVAKEASDFVLLDDSFTNIVNAIEEGRGIYDNIQKSIMLLLSGNLGEVLIIFLATILGFNLPLTAVLLLWINLITDGAPALAFSVDPYDKKIMQRQPKSSTAQIMSKHQIFLISFLGLIGSIIGLAIFKFAGGNQTQTLPLAQTMIFNFIVIYEIIIVFIIRKDYNVEMLSNKWLWLSIILALSLQALLMYTTLGELFGVIALSITQITIILASGIIFYSFYFAYQYLVKLKFGEIQEIPTNHKKQ